VVTEESKSATGLKVQTPRSCLIRVPANAAARGQRSIGWLSISQFGGDLAVVLGVSDVMFDSAVILSPRSTSTTLVLSPNIVITDLYPS
jgi:hypothetical protein